MRLTKQEVVQKLQAIGYEKPFTVRFTKVNGEERVMLASMGTPDEYKGDLGSLEALPVKDLEKSQWRSFRLDSVVSLEV